MSLSKMYDPTLPRTIATLVHAHGLKSVIGELAAYCEIEWVQAEIRNEPAEHWRNAGQALLKVIEDFPSRD